MSLVFDVLHMAGRAIRLAARYQDFVRSILLESVVTNTARSSGSRSIDWVERRMTTGTRQLA